MNTGIDVKITEIDVVSPGMNVRKAGMDLLNNVSVKSKTSGFVK